MDGILSHHSVAEESERRSDLRHNLIPQPREEQNRDFGDGGKVGIGCPDLMAKQCEISCWWNDPSRVNEFCLKEGGSLRRD